LATQAPGNTPAALALTGPLPVANWAEITKSPPAFFSEPDFPPSFSWRTVTPPETLIKHPLFKHGGSGKRTQAQGKMSRSSRRGGGAVTIQDVATAAGVSAMTVSRVVNDERNVRESTRGAVIEAIRRLNYSPNIAARSLAAGGASRQPAAFT
jgi:hypothetical protein